MTIEERWPCPRCGNRRTVVWSDRRSYCFNCGLHSARLTPEHLPGAGTAVAFTGSELRRLMVYRAAVAAGFYTDDLTPWALGPSGRPAAGDGG